MVHASRGRLAPGARASCCPRWPSSAGLARRGARPGQPGARGRTFARDYDADPRPHRARSSPASRTSTTRVAPPRRLRAAARARATSAASPPPPARPTSPSTRSSAARCPQGRLLLQTLRCHDQYNTTIYGLDDRYRGVKQRPPGGLRQPGRRARARPRRRLVRRPGQRVDGRRGAAGRPASGSCPTRRPAGCAAAYYPGDQRAGAAGLDRGRVEHARRRSRSWCGSNRTAVRWRLVERFRVQVFSLLSGWESGPWVTAKADAGQRHGWPVPATMRLCGASGASHLERRQRGVTPSRKDNDVHDRFAARSAQRPGNRHHPRSSATPTPLPGAVALWLCLWPGTITTSCPVQPVDAPLWTPLISRDAALAALPGRDASADEVLAAVAALARRIAPPGHLVDVGARGVFVDAAAKTRIPAPWSSRRRKSGVRSAPSCPAGPRERSASTASPKHSR